MNIHLIFKSAYFRNIIFIKIRKYSVKNNNFTIKFSFMSNIPKIWCYLVLNGIKIWIILLNIVINFYGGSLWKLTQRKSIRFLKYGKSIFNPSSINNILLVQHINLCLFQSILTTTRYLLAHNPSDRTQSLQLLLTYSENLQNLTLQYSRVYQLGN